MGYVIVKFPEKRDVFVDNKRAGATNTAYEVEDGHHIFKLAPPSDFDPPEQAVVVQNGTPQYPQEVSFDLKP